MHQLSSTGLPKRRKLQEYKKTKIQKYWTFNSWKVLISQLSIRCFSSLISHDKQKKNLWTMCVRAHAYGGLVYQALHTGVLGYTASRVSRAKRSRGYISIIRGNYSERPSSSTLIFCSRPPRGPAPHCNACLFLSLWIYLRFRGECRDARRRNARRWDLSPTRQKSFLYGSLHGDDPTRLYAREAAAGIIRAHHQSGEKIAFNCDYRGGEGSLRPDRVGYTPSYMLAELSVRPAKSPYMCSDVSSIRLSVLFLYLCGSKLHHTHTAASIRFSLSLSLSLSLSN